MYDRKIKDLEPAGVISELAGGRIGSSHQTYPQVKPRLADAALMSLNSSPQRGY